MNNVNKNSKNKLPDHPDRMKSPFSVPASAIMNKKAIDHAFQQHSFNMSRSTMQGMAQGGVRNQAPAPKPQTAPRGPIQQQPNRATPRATMGGSNSGTYSEGMTAVNPETGERLYYRGGRWVQ